MRLIGLLTLRGVITPLKVLLDEVDDFAPEEGVFISRRSCRALAALLERASVAD